jgi:nucleotide-binding universal stress UspA family protein
LDLSDVASQHSSRSGPVVIGFDGSEAARHAIEDGGALLRGRPALVVVVWKQGLGLELVEIPTATLGLPPAPIDIGTALEIDERMAERSQRLATEGARLAREAGLEAEGLAVADDIDVPVAETLVRIARERDAQAMLVGAHSHGRLGEVILGSVSRDVIRHAGCPVVVVRERARDAGRQ